MADGFDSAAKDLKAIGYGGVLLSGLSLFGADEATPALGEASLGAFRLASAASGIADFIRAGGNGDLDDAAIDGVTDRAVENAIPGESAVTEAIRDYVSERIFEDVKKVISKACH